MMSVTFEARNKKINLVKWNVGIPRPKYFVQSELFLVNGYNWSLKLHSDIQGHGFDLKHHRERWRMYLLLNEKELPSNFPLTVYVRNKGKDAYLCQREISSSENLIWDYTYDLFIKNYPDINVRGTTVQFIFDFNTPGHDVPNPVHTVNVPNKKNKCVQTSDSIDWEKYLDESPCLRSLSLDLRKLIDQDSDPDVQLKCGDFTIGAHKLILGARSEVFFNMMKSDMMEGRRGFVEIIDMEPGVFEVFIRYIYTGILPEITDDTALSLYEAADKYQVKALKKRSSLFLSKHLSQENALRVLVIADAHSEKDLKDKVVSYILDENLISRNEEWLNFCNNYPKLAVEVLNKAYILSRSK